MQSFWSTKGVPMSISVVKGVHQRERNHDKQTRDDVQGDISGSTVSNLFTLEVDPKAHVYRYALDIVGSDRNRKIHLPPHKALRLFGNRSLHNIKLPGGPASQLSLDPAVLAVSDHIYSRYPIPAELLSVRKEHLDSGWKHCRLVEDGDCALAALNPDAMQALVNRILPWSAAHVSQTDFKGDKSELSSVRERDGKIICTTDSISVEGIRVFEGTTAHALFVNGPFAEAPAQILTNDLADLRVGKLNKNIRFIVKAVEGAVRHQNRSVVTAVVSDASGDRLLRVWDQPNINLKVGIPHVAFGLHVVDNQHVLELSGSASTSIAPDLTQQNAVSHIAYASGGPRLMLRLDTKCTVASESSLWEEVVHHFGLPPYNKTVQRQINQAAEAMPVITSNSLRHGVVKILNFTADNLNVVPLHEDIRKIQHQLDQHQPLAILEDYSIWPLQTLHCCFDPHMKAWQDIAVSACSFFPARRVKLLNRFRAMLTNGLGIWGIKSSPYAATTSDVSILSAPRRKQQGFNVNNQQPQQQQQQRYNPYNNNNSNSGYNNYNTNDNTNRYQQSQQQQQGGSRAQYQQPSHRIFIGVPGSRASTEQSDMCVDTATQIAKNFHNSYVITAEKEVDAIAQLESLLEELGATVVDFTAPAQSLPIVTIFTTDRDSRACRWMMAECLRKGCIPVAMPPTTLKKVKLLSANCKLQIQNKVRTDPIGDKLDLTQDIPSFKGKNVLCVGVDTCHVAKATVGAMVGVLLLDGEKKNRSNNNTSSGNGPTQSMISTFWRVDVRGQELQQVTDNFRSIITQAESIVGKLDEIVVMQDGSVFSELQSMKRCVPAGCQLTFTCLHKRTNIRFHHQGHNGALIANNIRGTVVQALTPSVRNSSNVAPSFHIQSHDSAMSTARSLQVTVHCSSPTLSNQDLQQLLFTLSHASTFVPTKLPLPTRLAHKLASKVERLMDADPSFKQEQLRDALKYRIWYL